MISVKSFFKKRFVIPSNRSDYIEKKNKSCLQILFAVALGFGLFFTLFFAIVGTFVPRYMRVDVFMYYTIYSVVGLVGIFLAESKLSSKVIIGYALACLEFIFVLILYETSVTNCLICFLGLSFIFVILLDISPYVFSAFILQALVVIYIFQKHHFFLNPQNNRSFNVLMVNIILLFFTLIFLVFWKRNHVISEFNREEMLNTEQAKTEGLLRNIFPLKVIDQMKQNGVAFAETYSNVTVFCSDIVNFTKTTSSLEPELVINELNEVFSTFDSITEKYGCMRVKTIGDAYVAVCGVPDADSKHAEKMIYCARAIITYLEERNKKSQIQWNIRCGLSSGSVIAGVVGLRRYVYDVFGSVAEKAWQIEEKGKPMVIAVSDETYELVKDKIKAEKGEGCYYLEKEEVL